jgi:GntR family transcriptional repressor for pyruvate dehydrogenase complex
MEEAELSQIVLTPPSLSRYINGLTTFSIMNHQAALQEFLSPVKKSRVIEEILDKMRALLESGKLAQGTKLPAERDLCAMLSVSRPSLRDALKVLDILGVIKTRQGSGTYVTGSFARIVRDPGKVKSIQQRFTLLELLEARRAVEPVLASLAASRASEKDLATMARAVKGLCRKDASLEEHLRYDEQFHRAIISAADNSLFSRMMDLIWQPLIETFRITDRSAGTLDKSNNNHRQVFLAIKARDRQRARMAMLAVLKETEKDLLKQEKSKVFQLPSNRDPE